MSRYVVKQKLMTVNSHLKQSFLMTVPLDRKIHLRGLCIGGKSRSLEGLLES